MLSKRVEQTLEVLADVLSRRPTIGVIRSRAVRKAAKKFGVRPQTVHDKIVRQLWPSVKNAVELDVMIALCWGGDGTALYQAVLARAVTDDDRAAIDELFKPIHKSARLPRPDTAARTAAGLKSRNPTQRIAAIGLPVTP